MSKQCSELQTGKMTPLTEPADTDAVLDRCAEPDCGARARFQKTCDSWHNVACTECPNAVVGFVSRDRAMVAWNREQRRKGKVTP